MTCPEHKSNAKPEPRFPPRLCLKYGGKRERRNNGGPDQGDNPTIKLNRSKGATASHEHANAMAVAVKNMNILVWRPNGHGLARLRRFPPADLAHHQPVVGSPNMGKRGL